MKKVIVFLHGFTGNRFQFSSILSLIEAWSIDSIKCVCLTMPGTEKEQPLHDKTMQGYTNWLDLQLSIIAKQEEVDKVYLVGYSSATVLISRYINEFDAGRVEKIFQIAPLVRRGFKRWRFSLAPKFFAALSRILPEKVVSEIFRDLGWGFGDVQSMILDLQLYCGMATPVMDVPVYYILGGLDRHTRKDNAIEELMNISSDFQIFSSANHENILRVYCFQIARLIVDKTKN